ncbi:TIGR04283 family arsenosugar biosynthesis glycosyltransferase [Segetibacter aerophilus]|uniref:Glycosyl hydrolase n=1 Tax=Segetibacter aerophilus TaxID=670293 RepID=A0A512B8I8_9BACT|nr:TIGR04283 family arsenosugar biosynthesis glycosyltransferase [Segetibacter aerophilus]GEO08239.1 glycosyl hydrolase [Segetibacter aerophilus]
MISIVIPTYNEADNIARLVSYLAGNCNKNACEIIVSDGGSTDDTLSIAQSAGAKAVLSVNKGRAAQMNFGAFIAQGDILYFIHADTFPPVTFAKDIEQAVSDGYAFGRYRTAFASKKAVLKINAFFTRFDWFVCYGGDQTLFMTKSAFNAVKGFNEQMLIMEDYDIVTRAKEMGRYKILAKNALVSARKYDTNSWLKVQWANRTIVKMYKDGRSQQEMVSKYKELLVYR